ncbi:MAG TPA: hypothetical protein PKX15_01225, partial [Bacteroidales bacterium]|nr:hypothetical protein [Bacteroidales bacterium]
MKIHLRKRKLIKNGNISLYFEIYKGAISTNEGRTKPIRNYECLYLIDNPQTPFNKQHNKDTLALAES